MYAIYTGCNNYYLCNNKMRTTCTCTIILAVCKKTNIFSGTSQKFVNAAHQI